MNSSRTEKSMNHPALDLIEQRASTNHFDPSHRLETSEIQRLVQLATRAPTAYNLQNWRFIAVCTPEAKRTLRALAYGLLRLHAPVDATLRIGLVSIEKPIRPALHSAEGQALEARYVIRQQPEPVLEIPLDVTPSAAAGIGWAIGNLHLELSAEPTRLFAPDDPAARQLLDRLRVPYRPGAAVFRTGRFARGDRSSHELGPSHRH